MVFIHSWLPAIQCYSEDLWLVGLALDSIMLADDFWLIEIAAVCLVLAYCVRISIIPIVEINFCFLPWLAVNFTVNEINIYNEFGLPCNA